MHFSDFTPGRVFLSPPRRVTGEEIVESASRYDPQWFHVDAERAKKGRWQGLIASGWLTCSIAMELTVKHVLGESSAFGSPGVDPIKWNEPVRPGDALSLRFEVLRASTSPSRRRGISGTSKCWHCMERASLTWYGRDQLCAELLYFYVFSLRVLIVRRCPKFHER
jgi:acyl dehydratase